MGTLLIDGEETHLGEKVSRGESLAFCCNQDLGAQRQFDSCHLMRRFPKEDNICITMP